MLAFKDLMSVRPSHVWGEGQSVHSTVMQRDCSRTGPFIARQARKLPVVHFSLTEATTRTSTSVAGGQESILVSVPTQVLSIQFNLLPN